MKSEKIIITGGAGFIGSAFARFAASKGSPLVVVDKLTYAGDLLRLRGIQGQYKFYKLDICEPKKISEVFKKENPDIVVHFAAESHVDRSIHDASSFIRTNIHGTHVLLDACRKSGVKRFVHISTDEVYGDIEEGRFSERSPLKPSSPYAASKAAADLLVQAYIRTYAFPAIIVRPSNNYGLWQYPEKFIPLAILRLLEDKKIPLYGKGRNIREWLYVMDCAEGIFKVIKRGKVGQIYNLGSGKEERNINVALSLAGLFGKNRESIQFVKDRLGHDIRYSLDSRKLRKETGWMPRTNFSHGIRLTVEWYKNNNRWLCGKWKEISFLYK